MKLKPGLEPISIKLLGFAFIALLLIVGTSIVQGAGNIATAIALIASGSIIFIEMQLLNKIKKKDFDFGTLVLGLIGVTVIGLGLFSLTSITLPVWVSSARDYAIFLVAIALAVEILRA
jgi:hypothetical protein